MSIKETANQLAKECAVKCAKSVGMYDMDFHARRTEDVIANFIDLCITPTIPLAQYEALREAVEQSRPCQHGPYTAYDQSCPICIALRQLDTFMNERNKR